jgi:glycosyltransferase involved in cell wall biosynthesis
MRIGWILYGALEQLTGGYVYDARVIAALRAHGDSVELLSVAARDPNAAHVLINSALNGGFDLLVGDELCHPELAVLLDAFRQLKTQGIRPPRCALLVIVTSETSARRLALEFGVQADVCVPGADRLPLLLRRTDTKNTPLELLFVGTWTERKGLLLLIQALARLSNPAYRLRIFGETDREPAYRQLVQAELAQQPAVAERTQICGAVSDAALAQAYATSDVLVLPSYFEGYGMVLCEALRAGLALVATDVGAVPEVVRAGSDARLVPAGDVSGLACVLQELVSTRTEVLRLQANSAQRDLATWSDVGRSFRAVLTAALAQY